MRAYLPFLSILGESPLNGKLLHDQQSMRSVAEMVIEGWPTTHPQPGESLLTGKVIAPAGVSS